MSWNGLGLANGQASVDFECTHPIDVLLLSLQQHQWLPKHLVGLLSVVDYLKAMFLTLNASNKLRTLNNDTINIHNVPYLWVNFNSDIMFEFPPCVHYYDIQVNCSEWIGSRLGTLSARWRQPTLKMIFWLSFWNTKCLSHLCYLNDCYDEFVESSAHNEVVWGCQIDSTSHCGPLYFGSSCLHNWLQILWCYVF
jgi:hypothetical protein